MDDRAKRFRSHQIIVAAETTAAANDKQQAVPMAQAVVTNLAAAGERARGDQGRLQLIPNTADSGYYSVENVQGVMEAGFDPYFAVGRDKQHAPESSKTCPVGHAVASVWISRCSCRPTTGLGSSVWCST